MLNHQRPKKSLWNYDNDLQGFKLESYGEYEAGLEVFDSYGNKCNTRFLMNYGFLEKDNENNEVKVADFFLQDVPFKTQKLNILKDKISKYFCLIFKE